MTLLRWPPPWRRDPKNPTAAEPKPEATLAEPIALPESKVRGEYVAPAKRNNKHGRGRRR